MLSLIEIQSLRSWQCSRFRVDAKVQICIDRIHMCMHATHMYAYIDTYGRTYVHASMRRTVRMHTYLHTYACVWIDIPTALLLVRLPDSWGGCPRYEICSSYEHLQARKKARQVEGEGKECGRASTETEREDRWRGCYLTTPQRNRPPPPPIILCLVYVRTYVLQRIYN
jgi:hypothetical protein